MRTILHIIRKEFYQFKRDPKMFGIILIAPVLQLVLLGYAATLDVDVVHTVIYDMDKTAESRNFIKSIKNADVFVIDGYAENYDEVTESLDDGTVLAAVVLPQGFQKNIKSGKPASIQTLFNGSDGNTSSIAAGYLQRIIQAYSGKITFEFFSLHGMQPTAIGGIEPVTRVWFNPEMESKYFMVPSIVGLLLSIITLILTSLAVVKEKEIGTLEQLVVTPIKPYQLIIGKLSPFVILSFVAVVIVLTAMRFIFSIPIQGSIFFLFAASFVYIMSTLGLGLFVSTVSKTQQQAMMIAVFAVMMPMVFLSGFAFPLENMPEIIQYISIIIPLKYFLLIIRGVVLKGIGISELWIEVTVLTGMGIVILFLSSLRFRKRLE